MIDWHEFLGVPRNVMIPLDAIYRPAWMPTKQEYLNNMFGFYQVRAFPEHALEIE